MAGSGLPGGLPLICRVLDCRVLDSDFPGSQAASLWSSSSVCCQRLNAGPVNLPLRAGTLILVNRGQTPARALFSLETKTRPFTSLL